MFVIDVQTSLTEPCKSEDHLLKRGSLKNDLKLFLKGRFLCYASGFIKQVLSVSCIISDVHYKGHVKAQIIYALGSAYNESKLKKNLLLVTIFYRIALRAYSHRT